MKPKVLVIVGPTASGKSSLAISLAQQFNGEVISADSRQVYKGLNIGTGKVTVEDMEGVPHHMLDVADPKDVFTAADYQAQAHSAISDVIARGRLPIVCGGTGFYIQTIVDNITFPDVKPNSKLREELEKLSTEQLMQRLNQLDPEYATKVDTKSNVRIIRAIEIAESLGKVPPLQKNELYETLQIGIEVPDDVLRQRIETRLLTRIDQGMVKEVEQLHSNGLSWERMYSLGLEYRHVSRLLQGLISESEMVDTLKTEIWQYSRRQKTWFRRDKRIVWVPITELVTARTLVEEFI